MTDGWTDGRADGGLGRTLLWGGRRLGRRGGGGGGRGGALQGAQSLAEPGVLGRLDLVHQDSTLVLQLLSGQEERSEVRGQHRTAWRRWKDEERVRRRRKKRRTLFSLLLSVGGALNIFIQLVIMEFIVEQS